MTESDERLELKHKNAAAWHDQGSDKVASLLDSSLKKNTAFIKKARLALNAENLPSLVSDIRCLSLEKYLSEVVSAVAEGLGKVSNKADLAAAVEVVSLLHQRFAAQFTTVLAYQLVRGLSPPPASYLASLSLEQREKDETSRVGRHKNLIKVVTDLWLVGVFRSIQDAFDGAGAEVKKRKIEDPLPIFCLRELLSNDAEFTNLSIVTTFVKTFPTLLDLEDQSNNLQKVESQRLRLILQHYYDELTTHLRKQNRDINRTRSRMEDSTVAHGSTSSTRESVLNDLQRSHDRQIASAQVLRESLGQEPLVLEDVENSDVKDASIIRGVGSLKRDGNSSELETLWDDEEQRRFYEVLIDLSQVVPSDMLREDKLPENETPQVVTDGDDAEHVYEDLDSVTLNEPDDVAEQPSTTIGVKVQNLLVRLPEMTNKDLIDSAAVEFSFLNSKASRNRLVKSLLEISISRIDLLPYYARLIATLSQHLTSISAAVIASLHRDCRRYTHGKGLNKDVPKRALNIRFLSELIKFGLVPSHISFHCLKIMTEGFTKPDVEVLATMLEHCGRYLLRTESTAAKMEAVLTTVMRKARNTTGVERTLIENAFYYVNPPEQSGIARVERSSHDLYIDKLIYKDLSGKSHDSVLRLIKKLNWKDPSVYRYLTTVFVKPWRLSYSSIPLLAVILSGLSRFHSAFLIRVVDTVVEKIRAGLEENIFRENQKRVALMRYLGALYTYKVVDASLIFNTLYLLISHGTSDGRPVLGGTSADPGPDFFRVRLILTLLDTCGNSFSHGALRGRLDLFLCLFQYYLRTKNELPVDVEYDVRRTLGIVRPGLQLCKNLEEAASELDQAVGKSKDMTVENSPSDDDTDSTDSPIALADLEDEDSLDGHGGSTRTSADSDDDQEQEYVLLEKRREQDDLDKSAEEDLEREFSKLMTESLDTRKIESRRPLDIALPRKQITLANGDATGEGNGKSLSQKAADIGQDSLKAAQDAVKFTFLSRKHRPRQLDLPSDSPLVLHNAAHRIAEQKEKQTIRDLTLKYEGAQNREDLDENLTKAGFGVKYLPVMLAGQKGGSRSGSIFKMGARDEKSNR